MTSEAGSHPKMPRTNSRQEHRKKTPASPVEEYYERDVAIPRLDHIINSFEDRFSAASTVAGPLLGTASSVL